jgi:hypothetical protein
MATERGEHDVVAVAAVIADRERLAGHREMGAFVKPGDVTDDRVAAVAKDGTTLSPRLFLPVDRDPDYWTMTIAFTAMTGQKPS